MSDTAEIRSYVWHGGKCYFISTNTRQSSAAAAYGATYAETIVWDCDSPAGERVKILHMESAAAHSINKHLEICRAIYNKGAEAFKGEE
jgi:hypothetical protein